MESLIKLSDLFVKEFVSEEYIVKYIDLLLKENHRLRQEMGYKDISNLGLIEYSLKMYRNSIKRRLKSKLKRLTG